MVTAALLARLRAVQQRFSKLNAFQSNFEARTIDELTNLMRHALSTSTANDCTDSFTIAGYQTD